LSFNRSANVVSPDMATNKNKIADPPTIPIELRARDRRYIIDVLQSREHALRAQGQEDLDEEGEHIHGLIQDIETGLLRSGIDKARW
jgi:hypothetical protein